MDFNQKKQIARKLKDRVSSMLVVGNEFKSTHELVKEVLPEDHDMFSYFESFAYYLMDEYKEIEYDSNNIIVSIKK